MTKRIVGSLVALAVLVGIGAVVRARWPGAAAEPAPAAAVEPVARVGVERAQERLLVEHLSTLGEVAPGQATALSFTRAGQVTRLAVLPGDRVRKGAVLAVLALDPSAREAYAQATSSLALARREVERLDALLALQLATRSQVDAAQKAALDATGAVRALDAQGGAAATSTIAAPFDGVVASLAAAQGDRVAPGAPILQLARADVLRVQVGVDPAQRRAIQPGTKVSLTPFGAPGGELPAIDAAVTQVQDVVDPRTQLVTAIVEVPRSAGAGLVPGMKVRAEVVVGSRRGVAVPRDAVLSDDRGDYLFQVVGGKARRVQVEKLTESAGYTGIDGLTDLSLPVVTLGNYELHDGMPVQDAGQ